MNSRFRNVPPAIFLSIIVLQDSSSASEPPSTVPAIPHSELDRLLVAIRPQPAESPWREIRWLTSIREAREQAAREGKPIVVFTAADGSPLART
jgi:hypothetical protein